jgi:CelD/BcsL family acetyltransferase involved in cellulose biosynthesis
VHIEIVSSLSKMAGLHDTWNSLEPAMTSPLLRWEWFYSAAVAFHLKQRLHLIVALRSKRVMAVAPLVAATIDCGKRLELIGVAPLQEPCGLICDNAPAQAAVVNALQRTGLVVALERLDDQSERDSSIVSLFKGRGWTVSKQTGGTCFLPLREACYEDYLAGLPGKRRYDLRRLERRGSATGPFDCRIFNPRLDELERYLDTIFAVESRGWKGTRGSAILSNPSMERFFRMLCEHACRDGYLRLAMLSLQGNIAAAMIGAELGQRFWVFKIGYDERWSRYSPGLLMINQTVKYAFDRGLETYEFLGSNEAWIHLWSGKDNVRPKFLLAFYPYTVQGAMRLGIDGGRFLLRKIRHRIRL